MRLGLGVGDELYEFFTDVSDNLPRLIEQLRIIVTSPPLHECAAVATMNVDQGQPIRESQRS
jgi:hypothetical protein